MCSLQVSIGCPEKMEPITKVSHIPASRWALSCSLCREHTGTCIQVCYIHSSHCAALKNTLKQPQHLKIRKKVKVIIIFLLDKLIFFPLISGELINPLVNLSINIRITSNIHLSTCHLSIFSLLILQIKKMKVPRIIRHLSVMQMFTSPTYKVQDFGELIGH